MPKIKAIRSHKILNSRGDWTIETEVYLDNGIKGIEQVPDGASKGEKEVVCFPAEKAANIVSTVINDALRDEEVLDQENLDETMIQMDGTENKHMLGGNSILSVSLACAKAAAISKNMELYEYLSELYYGKKPKPGNVHFPTPVFNILNGGKHAQNNLSFQEFMIIPSKDKKFPDQLEIGVNVYHILKKDLSDSDFSTGVGDEGGFAPENFTANNALEFIRKSGNEKYKCGQDFFLGMDCAAESFYKDGFYNIKEENLHLNREDLLKYYLDLLSKFEMIYLEDGYYENDFEGWAQLYKNLGNKMMIVGDDLVVTNVIYLQKAIKQKLINSVIVKPNQVGSLSETLKFIKMAREAGMDIIISHRSGETGEDTFIADLAVGVKAEFLKSGAPVRGERVVKYNRLLEIYNNTV